MFLEKLDINKEYIIIGFKELKSYFIKQKSLIPQLNFKYYSLENLQESVFGKSTIDTIKESLKFLDDDFKLTKKFVSYIKKGVNENIDPRVKLLKDKLNELNLLTYDENFKELFKNKEVIILGYEENNIELNNVLKILNVKKKTYVKLNEIFQKNEFYVTKFLRNDEEIRYAFIKICKLLESGTKPNDIKIITDINTNYFYLKLYEKEFRLVLNLKEFKTLYDTKTSKAIERNIENLSENNIDEYDDKSEYFEDIKLLLETYDFYNLKHKRENYKAILSSYSINEKLDTQSIEVSSSLEYVSNKHIFIIGFDSLFYSQVNKNNDYFDDELKTKNNLNSTTILNTEGDSLYENFLNLNNTYYIYYHESDGSDTRKEISFYFKKRYKKDDDKGIDEQTPHILKPEILDVDYSVPIAKAYYSYYKDLKEKFFIDSEYYDLYNNYEGDALKLRRYDSSFKGINRTDNSKMTIYYTPLNAYYNCPFQYYCSYILKLNEFTPNFSANAGSLFHKVLEKVYDESTDFDTTYESVLHEQKDEFDDVELVILAKMAKICRYIFENLKTQKGKSNINDTIAEANVIAQLPDELNACVYGKIDSVLIADNYAQIIDYKTGTVNLNSDQFEYGVNLQLPIYKYVLDNTEDARFKGVKISGIYYINFDTKDYADFYGDNFRKEYPNYLKQGFTFGELESVLGFEPKLKDNEFSETIDKLKNSNGVLSGQKGKDVNFDKPLIDETGHTFSSMIEQIFINYLNLTRANKFDITPFAKEPKLDKSACNYCRYKDICFNNFHNYRLLTPLVPIEGYKKVQKAKTKSKRKK